MWIRGVPWGADGGHGGEELGRWQEDSALQIEELTAGQREQTGITATNRAGK